MNDNGSDAAEASSVGAGRGGDATTATTTTTTTTTIRGTVVRKRKYRNHVSLAIRTEEQGEKASLALVMVDRSPEHEASAFALEGCFVGSLVEAEVEDEDKDEDKDKDEPREECSKDSSDNNNNNNDNNARHSHRSARSLALLRSSPDPNAIQVCLGLVADRKLPPGVFSWGGGTGGEHEDNHEPNGRLPLPSLLGDAAAAKAALAPGPRDKALRALVKGLARGLKGEGPPPFEERGRVPEGLAGRSDPHGSGFRPRKRPAHIKRRHRAVLEAMEASQAPVVEPLFVGPSGGRLGSAGERAQTNTNAKTHTNANANANSSTTAHAGAPHAGEGTPSSMPVAAAYNLPDPHDPSLKSTRHPLTRREYLEDKKWPQIDWLVRRLKPVVEALGEQQRSTQGTAGRKSGKKWLEVLDVGGGRGDIAVAVAEAFPETRVTVVDTNASSLEGGRAYYESRKRWWAGAGGSSEDEHKDHSNQTNNNSNNNSNGHDDDDRVRFVCDDFAEYCRRGDSPPSFDVVIAWHACGDLSDYALEFSVGKNLRSNNNNNNNNNNGVFGAVGAFVICPCCYTKRYIKGFTPSWIDDYCCVPVTEGTGLLRKMPRKHSGASAAAGAKRIPQDGNDENENDENENKDEEKKDGEEPTRGSKGSPPIVDKTTTTVPPLDEPTQQQQQQQQQREQDVATVQRLAEINERPEITHRAMTVINNMRMRSLLAHSLSNNEGSGVGGGGGGGFDISLEEYDSAHSSKNLVLVGVRKPSEPIEA